ncbi:MAG: ACT domain-containing protein [Candidatus Methanomethylophilaceae archaeon]
MEKAVVTLVGMDTVGIIAKVCTYFAENSINILDIAQTTVRDVINMVMIVDIGTSDKPFDVIYGDMKDLSRKVKCIVTAVRYDELSSISVE